MERIEGIYHEINRRKDISASKEAFSAMTPKESLAASFNFVKQKVCLLNILETFCEKI